MLYLTACQCPGAGRTSSSIVKMDMPEELHAKLKQIAAFSRKSAKDLMLEGLADYIIPKYTKMPD